MISRYLHIDSVTNVFELRSFEGKMQEVRLKVDEEFENNGTCGEGAGGGRPRG
jgi:hypothetical protein